MQLTFGASVGFLFIKRNMAADDGGFTLYERGREPAGNIPQSAQKMDTVKLSDEDPAGSEAEGGRFVKVKCSQIGNAAAISSLPCFNMEEGVIILG